jgi:elongation factor P hydroxylase
MDDRQIADCFNSLFERQVRLVGGGREPFYQPAVSGRPAVIRYTRDYAQSALHEIAHWCLATPAARRQTDYGLAYQPPPRSPADQAKFYADEVPVQALEWVFARACGVTFSLSADNPGMDHDPTRPQFERRVRAAHRRLLKVGLPDPAKEVLAALNPQWHMNWLAGDSAVMTERG